MGKVSPLVLFSSIVLLFAQISGGCCRTLNQGNLDGTPPGVKASGNTISYVATHNMKSESNFDIYGIQVTTDVYEYPLGGEEHSGILVEIYNMGDGTECNQEGINIGRHVYPGLYRDSKTHLFVNFTWEGLGGTCYNLHCPGYKSEPNAAIVPGEAISRVSNPNGVRHTATFKLFNKDGQGDWLVYVGYDSEPSLIGRFPRSVFSRMRHTIDNIRVGGFVETHRNPFAPMGSGFHANNTKAASFSNIQLIIAKDGEIAKIDSDLSGFLTDENIYSISRINGQGRFTYGGPL